MERLRRWRLAGGFGRQRPVRHARRGRRCGTHYGDGREAQRHGAGQGQHGGREHSYRHHHRRRDAGHREHQPRAQQRGGHEDERAEGSQHHQSGDRARGERGRHDRLQPGAGPPVRYRHGRGAARHRRRGWRQQRGEPHRAAHERGQGAGQRGRTSAADLPLRPPEQRQRERRREGHHHHYRAQGQHHHPSAEPERGGRRRVRAGHQRRAAGWHDGCLCEGRVQRDGRGRSHHDAEQASLHERQRGADSPGHELRPWRGLGRWRLRCAGDRRHTVGCHGQWGEDRADGGGRRRGERPEPKPDGEQERHHQRRVPAVDGEPRPRAAQRAAGGRGGRHTEPVDMDRPLEGWRQRPLHWTAGSEQRRGTVRHRLSDPEGVAIRADHLPLGGLRPCQRHGHGDGEVGWHDGEHHVRGQDDADLHQPLQRERRGVADVGMRQHRLSAGHSGERERHRRA